MRRQKREQRGFALIIVVLLVALLAITGAALLDIVNVDIQLSGEHNKVVRSQMVADGALREVISDLNSQNQLPDYDDQPCGSNVPGAPCPNWRYNWAAEVGGVHTKNPDAINTPAVPLTEANSVFAKWTASPSAEENYNATVDIIRVVPIQDSGLSVTRALIWEVNTAAEVAGTAARHEIAAEIYKLGNYVPGTLIPNQHFR
jgi:Tfp pilus assembly protein PilX